MATKSGMRYQKMTTLVSDIGEIKTKMNDLLTNIQSERTSQVAAVYAADNFKSNMNKVADSVNASMDQIIQQLTQEAETQHDAYLKQEANLQSNINLGSN